MARQRKQAEPTFTWTAEFIRGMSNRAVGRAKAAESKLVKDIVATGVDESTVPTPFKAAYDELTTPTGKPTKGPKPPGERAWNPHEETKSWGQPRLAADKRIQTVFDYATKLDTLKPAPIYKAMRLDGIPTGRWFNPIMNGLFGTTFKVDEGQELTPDQLKQCKAVVAAHKAATSKPRSTRSSKSKQADKADEAAA